jgi:hypothetical protein
LNTVSGKKIKLVLVITNFYYFIEHIQNSKGISVEGTMKPDFLI